ncbi:MAG: DUF1508 domain-containing protein [Anaerolineales bacterium]|nr:DUF1508 domain-containing protein [Anaerolineales bacterium]
MTLWRVSLAKFQVYEDGKGEFRWRLRADNNEVIAISSEGYTRKESSMYVMDLVKKLSPISEVEDQT